MNIKLLIAPPAAGKTRYCMKKIREVRDKDPFAPVKVITAGRLQMAYWKRTLAKTSGAGSRAAGFIGTEILSFPKFSMSILDQVPDSPRLIPEHLDEACIRQAITAASEVPFAYFDPIKDKPGLNKLFAEAIHELMHGLVMPEKLAEKAGNDPKICDTAKVYRAYLDLLQVHNWVSPAGIVNAAADALEKGKIPPGDFPLLVIDGFDSLTKDCLRLIRAAAPSFKEVLITLPGGSGSGRTADKWLNDEADKISDFLQAEPVHLPERHSDEVFSALAENVLSADPAEMRWVSGKDFMMFTSVSQTAEAGKVLRQIKAHMLKEGFSAGDCAVFVPDLQTYAPILRQLGREMGIPLFFADHQPLSASPAAAVLLRLLHLSLDGYPAASLLAVLRSPFLSGRPDPLEKAKDSFERDLYLLDKAVYEMNLAAGLDEWHQAFTILENESQKARKEDDDLQTYELPSPEKIRRIAWSFDRLTDLLTPPKGKQTRAEWTGWLEDLLTCTLFCEQAENGALFGNSIRAVLKRMVFTEEKLSLQPIDYAGFVSELSSDLESSVLSIQGNFSDRVYAGDIQHIAGSRRKLIALMGFSESLFPRAEHDDLILTSEIRRNLSLMPLRDQSVLLIHALTRSDCTLILSRPEKTDTGEEWPASIYWQSVLDLLLTEDDRNLREADKLKILNERGILRHPVEAPASFRELAFEIRRGKMTVPKEMDPAQKEELQQLLDSAEQSRIRLMMQDEGAYGPQDDAALKAALADPVRDAVPLSCSVIEVFLNCPFRYLLSKKWKLEPKQLKEQGFDPAQLGTLNHKVLELTFVPGTVYASVDEALEKARSVIPGVLENAPVELGFRESELWKYEKEQIADKLLDTIAAMFRNKKLVMDRHWKSIGTEVPFGYPSEGKAHAAPLVIETEYGSISIRGWIDRLDMRDDGLLRAVDYKTGETGFTKAEIDAGSHIQAGVYAAAAVNALNLGDACQGAYWNISGKTEYIMETYQRDDGNIPGFDFLNEFAKGTAEANYPAEQKHSACPDYCPAAGWCRGYKGKD